MDEITKEDIRELKKARRYLLTEMNPTFRQQSRYSKLFLDKAKDYGVGLQQLHDHIASL